MRKKFLLLLSFCMLAIFTQEVVAQNRVITGVVRDASNKPLSDVTVAVKGTNTATKTNASGGYSIQAATGQTLVFTMVNYSRRQVVVGAGNTINAEMEIAQQQMDEVVVTAMDIKRNPKELGYSVQTVKGDEIQETQRENFITSLQGRVAGLTINTTSGAAGASSSIVLRGFNSLSMSNQPLFVIDGIIIDNSTLDENSNGGSGVGIVERGAGLTNTANRNSDYSNRISDINPNDILSVTVLKGPEATALYGSQASSGAIIITTRKAKTNKLGIQYDNSFRFSKITRQTETLDTYARGINGVSDTLYNFRYFGAPYPDGVVKYNNIDNFFRTGFAQTHNLGMDFGVGESKFRFSTSIFDQSAVVPTNDYKRLNLRLSNTTKIGKYIDISPAITYINTDNQKVLRSAGGFMLSLLSWPDTNDIRNYKNDNGDKNQLFSENPNADFDNPFFNVYKNKSADQTERVSTSLGININPTDWLSLAGRFGYETYHTEGYLRYHPLSYYISGSSGGLQDNYWRKYNGYNHTITATAKKTFADNFNARLMVGTMWQDYETQMFAISGSGIVDSIVKGRMYKGGVVITDANYDQLTLSPSDSNATRPATRTKLLRNVYGEYNKAQLRQFAYFGEIALNYKSLVFLNYTHRFEEASTLPKQNRKYNYPGASISVMMSDIFPTIKNGPVSFWKLRASRASTARLNSPYSTQSVFTNTTSSGGGFNYGFTNNNADLEPEKQNTYELGTEVRLFNNRLNIDAAYYNTLNKGQIIENFRLSYGTGFVLNTQNAGSTRNQGVELSIDATVIKKKDLNWNMRFNFNKMYNKVIALPKNVTEYYIADTWVYSNTRGGLQQGGATTTITSYDYLRNNAGDIIISPTTGIPVLDNLFKIKGDRNPDFTLGYNNLISYKNWQLNFLWDFKVGGDIFNGTEHYLTTIGKSKVTADRNVPRIISGVLQDGLENTATPTRNTISITPATYDSYYTTMPNAVFIEKDVNWARLKDLTISYTFKPETLKKLRGFKSLGAFVTANDLILITNYTGADPSVNGNTAGARGVGAFGFDYGTLPTPISVNFGLRASF